MKSTIAPEQDNKTSNNSAASFLKKDQNEMQNFFSGSMQENSFFAPGMNSKTISSATHASANSALGGISSQLPAGVTPDKTTKQAKFKVSNVDFIVEPDEQMQAATTTWRGMKIEPESNGGLTALNLQGGVSYQNSGNTITSVTHTYKLYIKTFYAKGVKPTDSSAYGRGTTADDKKNGNTSLQFHEGNHGQDAQDYVAKNPMPVIAFTPPGSKEDYDAAAADFMQAISDYQDAMNAYSEQNTDEVGTPKTPVQTP